MDKDTIVEERDAEAQLPPDPGELEGTKKDPKSAAEDMPVDHPRFREVYAKMKSYERELETFRESWKNTDNLIAGMRDHNKRLAEALERSVDKKEASEQDDPIAKLDVTIKSLRAEKKKAMDDLKYGEAEDIQEQIEDLREKRLFEVAKKNARANQPPKPKAIPEDDMRIYNKFIEENEWYNEDPLMRAAALQLDSILLSDPKWSSKSIGDRLNEVKKRIEKRFGYVNDSEPSRQMAAAVDSGRSGSPRSNDSRANSLSPEEEAVAKGLRLTNEQYIKQKRMGGAR